MTSNDTIQRFLFDGEPLRGEFVHLDTTWQTVLERHKYPQQVQKLLGELMAATALLAATIKIDGSLSLQLKGSGDNSFMLAECTGQNTMRAIAHWSDKDESHSLSDTAVDGQLVITIDPGENKKSYQSTVSLNCSNLAEALKNYLTRSEQLQSQLVLAANATSVVGILVQKLPGELTDDDAWNRIELLSATISKEELFDCSLKDLLRRLFHQDNIRLFEPAAVSFRCQCTRERVQTMLRGLGYDEVNDIITKEGSIGVNCEFCNKRYQFDRVDAEQIFAADVPPDVPPTRH